MRKYICILLILLSFKCLSQTKEGDTIIFPKGLYSQNITFNPHSQPIGWPGRVYYDTTLNLLRLFNGSAWSSLSMGIGATNGLQLIGGLTGLGGSLTQNTYIDGNFSLNYGYYTPVNTFYINTIQSSSNYGTMNITGLDAYLKVTNGAGKYNGIDIPLYGNGNITMTGSVNVSNDFTYKFNHLVASADSIQITIGGTQNKYYKITTGGVLSVHDSSGYLLRGDSVMPYLTKDATFAIFLGISSNANDIIRIKLYDNNSASSTSLGRFIVASQGGTTNLPTSGFIWYKHPIQAGHWYSIRAANLSANHTISISDIKIIIINMPEL